MSVNQADIAQALSDNEIFGVLDDRTRDALAQRAVEHHYKRGETVFVKDERGESLFLVVKGMVKIFQRSRNGEVIEISRKTTAETFGEIAILDGGPRSASAEATAPTVLISFSRDIFIIVLQREPATVDPLLKLMGRLIRSSSQLSADLTFLDLKGRLARRLLQLADDNHEITRDRRVSQTELAQMVGASRQTVNSALRSLEDEGIISLDASGIRLLSAAQLERLSE